VLLEDLKLGEKPVPLLDRSSTAGGETNKEKGGAADSDSGK